MLSASSSVTRVRLLRPGDQSPDRSSDSEDEEKEPLFLQVVPEEESGLAAAAVLLQLQQGTEGSDRAQH